MPGFGLSPVDPSIRTNMETGAQKVRRRTVYRLDRVSMQWVMYDTEMAAFRSWYEGLPISIAGDSDSLSTYTLAAMTLSTGGGVGPDGVTQQNRLFETTANATHRGSQLLPAANADNLDVMCRVTLKALGGRINARLSLEDRAGASRRVDLNMTTGVLSNATSLVSSTVEDRGSGWYRVTIVANTGTGATTPIMRVAALDDSGLASFVGVTTKGLRVCEAQARFPTGFDLFVPSDAAGNALGCDGGSSWFWTYVAVGGGLKQVEARFTGGYKATALPGLRWNVTGDVEVRNA